MLSKNNHYGKQLANTPHTPRYALRRLKVGLVSVALGTVFFFTPQALADTTSGVDTSTDPSTLTTTNAAENHTTNALSSANAANKVSLTILLQRIQSRHLLLPITLKLLQIYPRRLLQVEQKTILLILKVATPMLSKITQLPILQ